MSTTTPVEVFGIVIAGIGEWFATAAIYLFVFAIMWFMFMKGIKLIVLWKNK